MIAHNPLHGSGQAGFPHPALALGDDAHTTQGVGMTDGRRRQPASDEAPHTIPEDAAVLAAPHQRTAPEASYLEPEQPQRRCVHGHSVVPNVSTPPPLPAFSPLGDGIVQSSLKFSSQLVQLRLQSFAHRLPQHRVHSIASLLYADMREAEKVERLRFAISTPLPVVDRKRTKFQQACFLGMQFQVELPHSFSEFRPKVIGIRFAVESNHDVVRESHHDDIAVCVLLTPCLDPQIEHVMKIDVGQERRGTSTLGRPFLRPYSLPVLQHAGPQPFLDEPYNTLVCDPMLDELHQPFVRNAIEEASDVQVEHPVHFSRQQSRVERVQRLVLAASWPEPVRKSEKVRFVDGVHHLDRGTLDDLVFQRRHSERSLPPVGFGNVHSTHRLRSVRSSLQPFRELLEIFFRLLPVMPPRLPVHARRGFLLQREVGHPQRFQVIDVVQERGEPHLLILSCCLTYPLQRTGRVAPARSPGRVLLGQVPFGQPSSLHPLRRRLSGIVRELPRYYRAVRLPKSVRHRRASLDFSMRPKATATLGGLGISRFPREVFPYVLGVSDRAGLWYTSRYRCTRWSLPLLLTASASRSKFLSRLNTRPARSPANASTPPLRATPHDSGPMWVGRVRWWRGSGLRMMPTFPPPPLSFRTAGFPQYGWKVGFSGSAFPRVAQVKPAPGMPCPTRRCASALRAPRFPTLRPALCRNNVFGSTLPCEELSPLPQRPSLRSGFYCPSPSTLNRPHPSHSQAHPVFAAGRLIRDAFAVLVRLGDPRVVPCFRCSSLLDMPPSTTAGSSLAACTQFLRQRCWPSPEIERLGTPKVPHHPLPMGRIFAASLVRYALRPVELLAPLADPTGCLPQPSEAFTPGLSNGSVALP